MEDMSKLVRRAMDEPDEEFRLEGYRPEPLPDGIPIRRASHARNPPVTPMI